MAMFLFVSGLVAMAIGWVIGMSSRGLSWQMVYGPFIMAGGLIMAAVAGLILLSAHLRWY